MNYLMSNCQKTKLYQSRYKLIQVIGMTHIQQIYGWSSVSIYYLAETNGIHFELACSGISLDDQLCWGKKKIKLNHNKISPKIELQYLRI